MTNEQMRQRIAELEEGLRPLADLASLLSDRDKDEEDFFCHDGRTVKNGDIRRAASLLSAPPPASEPGHKCYEGHILRQRDNDIGILIAIVESLLEASGESLDTEDNALFGQIRNDHENRTDPASEPDADVVERWAQDTAKSISERAGKNASVAPELLYAPVLWELRAAIAAMRPAIDWEKIAEIRERHDSVADMADDEWDNRIYTIADDAFSDRAALLSMIGGLKDV